MKNIKLNSPFSVEKAAVCCKEKVKRGAFLHLLHLTEQTRWSRTRTLTAATVSTANITFGRSTAAQTQTAVAPFLMDKQEKNNLKHKQRHLTEKYTQPGE